MPLLFVQQVPSASAVQYISSIGTQRDLWMRHPQSPHKMDTKANGIHEIQCVKAEMNGNIKRCLIICRILGIHRSVVTFTIKVGGVDLDYKISFDESNLSTKF